MTTRRTLLRGATATVLGTATAGAKVLAAPLADPSLEPLMERQLARALGDEGVAGKLAPLLYDATMLWSYPQMPAQEADSLIAYSFGNRLAPGADGRSLEPTASLPGPINASLAEAVSRIRAIRDIPVYAQWEIAQILEQNYHIDRVTPLYPERGADGAITYLSTEGVAKAALRHAGSASALGRVAIVGHRDHVKRCILTSQQAGLTAAAISGIALPVAYDPQSGQPWTRDRTTYLLGDIMAQLMIERSKLLR
ncbi:hypothetical protein [Novosphingobium rosa]|uniref:hypothetical protein n=1 Tax=Novosphingobium rosa TaxID=76978 RepID=UPI000830EF53|nr:hypothetical protein [Novosphingobium rosa]